MLHSKSPLWGLVLALGAACSGESEPDVKVTPLPDAAASRVERVLPKSGEVWGRDLAAALALDEFELCQELGTEDCIRDAHRITMGGMEAERLGIDEPLENALVSAPIAFERVAISACGVRYDRDGEGTPVLFGAVRSADTLQARRQVGENLVRRLLARQPTQVDVDALEGLHGALSPISDDLVRDWSVGACVVVATSTEALFY